MRLSPMLSGLTWQAQKQAASLVQPTHFASDAIVARQPLTADVASFSRAPQPLHFGSGALPPERPSGEDPLLRLSIWEDGQKSPAGWNSFLGEHGQFTPGWFPEDPALAIEQIDAPLEQKNLLKSVFFDREILDLTGKDTERIEQFETGEMLVKRLQNTGFEILLPVDLPHSIPDFPAISIQSFKRFIGFTTKEHPIISILIAH